MKLIGAGVTKRKPHVSALYPLLKIVLVLLIFFAIFLVNKMFSNVQQSNNMKNDSKFYKRKKMDEQNLVNQKSIETSSFQHSKQSTTVEIDVTNRNVVSKLSKIDQLPRPLTRVKYVLVDREKKNKSFVRFAAFHAEIKSDGLVDDSKWKPLSVKKWAELIACDSNILLRKELSDGIKNAAVSYPAFFFETKGTSSKSAAEKQFEFVLVNSPELHKFCERPDPHAFAEHLQCLPNEATCCSFKSLGGDAILVAPRSNKEDTSELIYSNLGVFLQGASDIEIEQFWRLVGEKYKYSLLSDKSVWLSTSGLGVAWLHMRIDSRPKYYTFKLFKDEL